VGQEVLVDFLEGDMDRPVICGVIHNGRQRNPYFSGEGELPPNKTLSGIKTKEHNGSQYGELLFDDTQDQVRTKLSSEHGKTQLNQGYLIHPRKNGLGEPRGDGVELRTDRHAALRAAEGLLLTTETQPQASGKQLDREQALAQFQAAQQTAQTLGDVAEHQTADVVEIGPEIRSEEGQKEGKAKVGHIDHFVKATQSWETGTNTDPEGKTAVDGQTGRQPVVIMSGAEGVGMVTPKELVFAAESNLDTVSQRDTQQSTARRWIHNVGKKISLFVHGVADKVNLKLITAKGHAQFQTHKGDIEIVGDQSLFIDACKKKLTVTAAKELLLTSSGGYIKLSGGNVEIHCPGSASFKASNFDLSGPASMDVEQKSFGEPTLCSKSAITKL
jgi:type VI secretion system secreted protein VgrG